MGWIIDVQGAQLREEDVRMAHVSVANAALGTDGWDIIDPMSSPAALTVWCAVAVAENTAQDLDMSLLFIQTLPVQEVLGCFHRDSEGYVSPHVEAADETHEVEAKPGDTQTEALLSRAATERKPITDEQRKHLAAFMAAAKE